MSANVGSAVARLRKLSAGLRSVGSGEASLKAATRIAQAMKVSAAEILSSHVHTGNAASTLEVNANGNRVEMESAYYLKFHAWWVFRKGIPADLREQSKAILKEETLLALKG